MNNELIFDDYGDPCGVRNSDTALSFTVDADAIVAALNKVALFDVLAARIETEEWDMPVNWNMPVSEAPVAIRIRRTGERVHGATLAEAVEKAMEAEGGGK